MKKYIRYWLLAVWMVCMTIIGGCSQILNTAQTSQVLYETETETITEMLAEDGVYTSKEDVALYIHLYGKLPENFITKKEGSAYELDDAEKILQSEAFYQYVKNVGTPTTETSYRISVKDIQNYKFK